MCVFKLPGLVLADVCQLAWVGQLPTDCLQSDSIVHNLRRVGAGSHAVPGSYSQIDYWGTMRVRALVEVGVQDLS